MGDRFRFQLDSAEVHQNQPSLGWSVWPFQTKGGGGEGRHLPKSDASGGGEHQVKLTIVNIKFEPHCSVLWKSCVLPLNIIQAGNGHLSYWMPLPSFKINLIHGSTKIGPYWNFRQNQNLRKTVINFIPHAICWTEAIRQNWPCRNKLRRKKTTFWQLPSHPRVSERGATCRNVRSELMDQTQNGVHKMGRACNW